MKKLIYSCLALLAFISFFSCSSSRQISNVVGENIKIKVEHNRKDDSWNVTYKLPKKVNALFFNRQTNTFRHKSWKVKTPGLELKLIDGKEYIISTSGNSFDLIDLIHNSYYEYTPKDYEFFFKYSDGDVLMYTGHYDVFPIYKKFDLEKGIKEDPEDGPMSEYRFIPVSGEKVVILGSVHNGQEVKWLDKKGRGTYVYWGNTKPLEIERLVVVIDRKVPKWLADAVQMNLPKLFDFYKDKTDVALNFKPVVFLNYAGEEEDGYYNSGGTLPGLIQLTLKGKDWKKRDSETFEYLFKFLAHEAAHLWNGQMFRYKDGKHSWMHEGGADAFAYRAMKELDIFSKERYLEYINSALNKCILGLDGSYPLMESAQKRSFKNYYRCGSTIALLTELSLKKGGLFTFWSSLFRNAEASTNKYDDVLYLKEFKRLSDNEEVLDHIKSIVYGPIGNTGNLFRKAFNKLNLKLGSMNTSNQSVKRSLAKKLLEQLYRKDCGGSLNLTRKRNYYLVHGAKECKTFKKDFKVKRVGKHYIFKEAVKAYEHARLSCFKNKNVSLIDTENDKLSIPCSSLIGPFDFFEILEL